MSETVVVAIINAIPPVLVAVISIVSNTLITQAKIEQLSQEVSRIHWLEREHIEDGRIINDLIVRMGKLEEKNK